MLANDVIKSGKTKHLSMTRKRSTENSGNKTSKSCMLINNVKVYEEYKNDDNVNDALLWEMIKLKIREKSMQYAAAKKAKISRKEEELEKTINALQNLVDSNRIGEKEKQSALNELEDKRIQLEKIVEYKTKGAILRAKCRWHNEGEKNTKYFLNLEKRHFKNDVINQLEKTLLLRQTKRF